MIQSVNAYKVGEMVFPTIQQAQKEELISLLTPEGQIASDQEQVKMVDSIIAHTDQVVAILTCQPKAKAPRKPRSDIGKKRSPKDSTIAAL